MSDLTRPAATDADFARYLDLLRLWSPKINLVSRGTLAEAETRHVADSVQLLRHRPATAQVWADLGSGAGFPGLAVAIAAKAEGVPLEMHLVESDQRKAAFLRTVSRETSTPVTVHAARAEALPAIGADIVSARALAPLDALLPLAHRHLYPGGVALLLKGRNHAAEQAAATERWRFSVETHPSCTDDAGVILKIGDIRHV